MAKLIFITGATSDIAREFIQQLPEDHTVLAHFNSNKAKLEELQKVISARIIPIKADFSNMEDVEALVSQVEAHGVPDAIIHLAAPKFENIRFKDISVDKFQNELDISLTSFIVILGRLVPQMAKLKRGRVICMLSSVTIGVPPKALAQYTTIKFALLGLMKSLSAEYASKHLTFNSISPSMVETQFLSEINEKIVELSAYTHPLKRNATVSDVIPVLSMLLSDEAAYINGVNIPVTGGSLY